MRAGVPRQVQTLRTLLMPAPSSLQNLLRRSPSDHFDCHQSMPVHHPGPWPCRRARHTKRRPARRTEGIPVSRETCWFGRSARLVARTTERGKLHCIRGTSGLSHLRFLLPLG